MSKQHLYKVLVSLMEHNDNNAKQAFADYFSERSKETLNELSKNTIKKDTKKLTKELTNE